MATSPLVTAGDLSALSNFPAMLPPHGQSINFDNPVSRGETYTAVTTTLIVLMVLFVANRGYTKHFITRKLGWDDRKSCQTTLRPWEHTDSTSSNMLTRCGIITSTYQSKEIVLIFYLREAYGCLLLH